MDATMQPMLCKPNGVLPPPERADEWVMEPKIDGWRGIIHVQEGGIVKTYARSGADHSNVLFHVDQALMDLAPDTVFDGEIVGADWNQVQGVMTRGTTAAIIVQELSYVAFDVLRVGGQDARTLSWEQRRSLLEQLHDQIEPEFQSAVVLNAYGPPSQDALDELLALGMEGVVIKSKAGRYVNGRSPLWAKIKPQETTEAEVVGFKDGKKGGKFDGRVGAFHVKLLDTGVETTAKCGRDEIHDEATRERDGAPKPGDQKWLGTIVELKHHGWQPSGKVRHPQILRRRDDHEVATAKGLA